MSSKLIICGRVLAQSTEQAICMNNFDTNSVLQTAGSGSQNI